MRRMNVFISNNEEWLTDGSVLDTKTGEPRETLKYLIDKSLKEEINFFLLQGVTMDDLVSHLEFNNLHLPEIFTPIPGPIKCQHFDYFFLLLPDGSIKQFWLAHFLGAHIVYAPIIDEDNRKHHFEVWKSLPTEILSMAREKLRLASIDEKEIIFSGEFGQIIFETNLDWMITTELSNEFFVFGSRSDSMFRFTTLATIETPRDRGIASDSEYAQKLNERMMKI